MSIQTLESQLKTLHLKTIAIELREFLRSQQKSVSLDWLIELMQREIDSRKEKSLQQRIKRAMFPSISTLEEFDWDFNKKIDKAKILELADLHFIKKNEIALFLGFTGTGKSHLAIAIGLLAIHQGYPVYWCSLKRLAADIRKYKDKGDLSILFKKILDSRLWIVDDWGVVSLPRDIAEEVFDLFDRRKHSTAMILTSNRDVNEWPQVFSDPVLASAAIDRIFEDAHVTIFEGDSYRHRKNKEFKRKQKTQIKEDL